MANELTATNGPITAFLIENEKALAVFSQKERNTVARAAMTRTANMWIEIFLPLRFTKYAFAHLRYYPTAAWESVKRLMENSNKQTKGGRKVVGPQPTPLVFTGDMRRAVLGGANSRVTATQSRPVARVRMPVGHAIKQSTAAPLKHLPPNEVKRLSEIFKKAFSAAIGRAGNRSSFRASEAVAKRAAVKAARAETRAAGKASRAAARQANRKPKAPRPRLSESEKASRRSLRAYDRRIKKHEDKYG